MENSAPLRRVERARDDLVVATRERIDAVLAAREEGCTWRAIAEALGITERATIKLVRNHEARTARTED